MKKIYIIEHLDCANCAAKIEGKFNALEQVEEATITFATRQLRLTAEDPDALIPQLTKIARTVEPEATIVPREEDMHHNHHHGECGCGHHHGHEGCGCGGHHHDHDECGCGHHHGHEGCGCGHHHGADSHVHHADCGCGSHTHEYAHEHDHHHDHGGEESPKPLILGAGLFVLGLAAGALHLDLTGKLLHVLAYVVLGLPIVKTALKNLTRGHVFDENFLMTIATLGAFLIGEFPEAVGVMLFYRVGEFFEHKAVERSRSQIMDAVDLRPEVVTRLHRQHEEVISAGAARVGDVLLVRPGDRIPLDGIILTGQSRIDTAPITGEPVPVQAGMGDTVISGCVNVSGTLTIRVEKPLAESMVTRILNSVENAAASKPKIDRFITRFARIYTPVVVALAAATAIIPSLITGEWNYWVYTALSFLVMSCPCALVLSVPLAFFSGIGAGSKRGILFKGGVSMEAMGRIKAVVMDKTGTVTKGDFSVKQVVGGDGLLALCAGCEQHSTHPIAQSIVAAAKAKGLELPSPEQMEELSGRGIRAVVDGKTVLCGNVKLMEEFGIPNRNFSPDTAGTYVLVAVDGVQTGWLRIADTLKPEGKAAVERLQAMDIHVSMLTGDNEESARAVAEATGIAEVHARLLPDEKLQRLRDLRGRKGAVMFVGDGINDAPVLAGADVGGAMGSGADAAIEAADVVYMTSDLGAVPQSLAIAARTRRIAWQNVVFALAVKLVVMALGLMGHASMWMAVFADSGVAMLCVLNSIRMLYGKKIS